MSLFLPAARLAALVSLPPEDPEQPQTVVVTGQRKLEIRTPASTASTDAETIARTVNAVNVEDTLKYLPSLIVRKRHIGDTQAPLATRTSGLGASARSLVYADGALLSALIGNNNTNASPKWGVVSTEEIARIDVLYGPFSAAYPGNSTGAVVNIATRLPDRLEATLRAAANVQELDQYGTRTTLPSYQLAGTVGQRFGPLALFASVDHVESRSQPITYVTVPRSASPKGGFDDVNRTGAPIRVFGASGLLAQVQERYKLKVALDVTPDLRLTYVGVLFRNDTDADAESYLTEGSFTPAFSNGVYRTEQRHFSHSLTADGVSGRLDWRVIGTRYSTDRDVQRTPTTLLPAAQSGGAGTITRLDGTGWWTLDARASWRSDAAATHVLSAGLHGDWFRLASDRFVTGDWRTGSQGALNLRSAGRTRTLAVWAEDAWKLTPYLTLTVGGRHEWWCAYDGVNFSPPIDVAQPSRDASRFSPKATLAWAPDAVWTLRASYGEAWRFPTVGELYQVVATPVPAVPNSDLAPERARSIEVAAERHDARGLIRLALFNEVVDDALISQTGPVNGTTQLATFVQNVDRTRARGAELAVQRTELLPRVDVSGSVTYARAETARNRVFPAAIGKLLPGVPAWKATLVTTWRPTEALSLNAAGRYASRIYGTLDNSDSVGNTYQGFEGYIVVDLRAQIRAGDRMELGLGVDNLFNRRYFLFHPFPHRSFTADMTLRF